MLSEQVTLETTELVHKLDGIISSMSLLIEVINNSAFSYEDYIVRQKTVSAMHELNRLKNDIADYL